VAYLGLALSAFVYVPFAEGLFQVLQSKLAQSGSVWDADGSTLGTKMNPGRLRDQMFAFTVTNQIVNTFMEIGLPFILRAITWKSKKEDKKKVVFEDEQEKGGNEERKFLEQVRKEAALPEPDLFLEYQEMVTQFGYVVLWSTIWPLAPGKITSVLLSLNDLKLVFSFPFYSNGIPKQFL
jgi:anoctamin-10